MFWRFNYLSSEIDTLLDKEDVTLLEIIGEEDVLQECKAQNNKLVEYLTRPENLKELVNMVVTEPSMEVEEKMRYKYPNISCELLTSDINAITDALAGTEPLLDQLLGFLDNEETLNPLQASFFSKVVGLLITRKSQATLDYLKARRGFLEKVLHHLDTSAIMDLLLRLVMSMDGQQCKTDCLEWLKEEKLITHLIDVLKPSNKLEAHYNAAQSLCDLIKHGRDQVSFEQESQGGEILLNVIQSEESISMLLDNMFEDTTSESSILSGILVLQTLLEFKKVGPEGPLDSVSSVLPDIDKFLSGVEGALKSIVPRLKDFHALLSNPPKQHFCPMATTIGLLELPFGNTRLQVARLFNCLLTFNYNPINQELHRLGSLGVLLDLFFSYSWNNFLHKQFEQSVFIILTNAAAVEDSPNKNHLQLLTQLIVELNFLVRIMDAFINNEDQIKNGGHRLGYMGHLSKISNSLSGHKLKELIEGLPEDTMERWSQFVSTTMNEYNRVNLIDGLGNNTPATHSVTDEDFCLNFQPSDPDRKGGFIGDELLDNDDVGVTITDTFNWSNLSTQALENSDKKLSMFEDMCESRGSDLPDEDVWEEKLANFPESLLKPDVLEKMRSSSPEVTSGKHVTSPTVEEMEVSSTEGWAKFDEHLPMDEGTPNSPSSSSPSANQTNASDNWADFSQLEQSSSINHAINTDKENGDCIFNEAKKEEILGDFISQTTGTSSPPVAKVESGLG